MNEEEKNEILRQFRDRLSDVLQPGHDDEYLLRWLRARRFDLRKSEEMLRNHLRWRAQVGADDILSWPVPEIIRRFYPSGLIGYDKEGRPVWIEPIGRADCKGIMSSVKRSDLIRYKIYHCELIQKVLRDQTTKLQRHCKGLVIVFDLDQFGMKHLWKPANWKDHLLRDINADQLPVHWGGMAVDPDGDIFCQSRLPMGGPVDVSFYRQDLSLLDKAGFTCVTVAKRSALNVSFTVDAAGSILRWQFMTEHHDIGFSITFNSPGDTSDNIHSGVI